MRRPSRSRVFVSAWLAPLCVAAWLLMPASAGAISSSACDKRANDTPDKLVPCIQTNDLWGHMQAFQQMVIGGTVSDAVATLGTLNIIAGELDR